MKRRSFLKSAGAATAVMLAGRPTRARAAQDTTAGAWRTFEVTTRVEPVNPTGTTRVWVPLPLTAETDYFRGVGDAAVKGNAAVTRTYRDAKYDAALLYAEWPSRERAPVIEIVNRFATRDRALDLGRPPASVVTESPAELAKYLGPTKFIPTDGLVLETAREVTQNASTDLDRARAIYEWIVDNTFRDPKVRGCGLGDIKTMLETRYFGGKCADLNALFVGLARAVGIPARDVYGIRVADSREFTSLGKSGDVSKAQHCRAEFYHADFGWVPVDPADVRKVVLEEAPGLTIEDAAPKRARAKLFGRWEMNYLPYNRAHDVKLANSSGAPLAFLMYPQAETAEGRKDALEPVTFRYRITSRELHA